MQKNFVENFGLQKVACKRRSSVNSRDWLRRFDDVTGVENSCIAKSKKGKKVKEKCCIIVQAWNTWKFAMLKILYIHNC